MRRSLHQLVIATSQSKTQLIGASLLANFIELMLFAIQPFASVEEDKD